MVEVSQKRRLTDAEQSVQEINALLIKANEVLKPGVESQVPEVTKTYQKTQSIVVTMAQPEQKQKQVEENRKSLDAPIAQADETQKSLKAPLAEEK